MHVICMFSILHPLSDTVSHTRIHTHNRHAHMYTQYNNIRIESGKQGPTLQNMFIETEQQQEG